MGSYGLAHLVLMVKYCKVLYGILLFYGKVLYASDCFSVCFCFHCCCLVVTPAVIRDYFWLYTQGSVLIHVVQGSETCKANVLSAVLSLQPQEMFSLSSKLSSDENHLSLTDGDWLWLRSESTYISWKLKIPRMVS